MFSPKATFFLLLGLIVPSLCVLFYILNKSILFGVYNGGDRPIAMIRVPKRVINGVKIDFGAFQKAAVLLNKQINGV
jgi:hypothetical protein